MNNTSREFSDFAGRRGWHLDENGNYKNPKSGEAIPGVICRDDGRPLWDQFIYNEPIGVILVPVNKRGEIRLITVERLIFKDEAKFSLCDFSQLGPTPIEIPCGFPFKGEKSQETAARKATEEIGSLILESRLIGYCRPNSTFHPYQIPVYFVLIDDEFQETVPTDVNEKILRVIYYPFEEAKKIVVKIQITCEIILAATNQLLCYSGEIKLGKYSFLFS